MAGPCGHSSSREIGFHKPTKLRLPNTNKMMKWKAGNKDLWSDPKQPLDDLTSVENLTLKAAKVTFVMWVSLLCIVFFLVDSEPQDDSGDEAERWVARAACFTLFIGILVQLVPTFRLFTNGQDISAILIAGLLVMAISVVTNGLLGWAPRVVKTDPVTDARVFLVRWAEWIPLAGFQTLLAEATDIPAVKNGKRGPVTFAIFQTLCVGCGMVFPFCPTTGVWAGTMAICLATFSTIFPRVYLRKNILAITPKGDSVLEREHYNRRNFSYSIMFNCLVVWCTLVFLYFLNFALHKLLSEDHALRFPGLAMSIDTIFDVFSKLVYTQVIVRAHHKIFAVDMKMVRHLCELRHIMGDYYLDATADAVVVSRAINEETTLTMLSPSFLELVGAEKESSNGSNAAVVLEMEGDTPTKAYYVDVAVFDDINAEERDETKLHVGDEDLASELILQARQVYTELWKRALSGDFKGRILTLDHCKDLDGRVCRLNSKRYSHFVAVGVVVDVTDKYEVVDN